MTYGSDNIADNYIKLLEIYKNDFINEIPINLLQLSRFFTIYREVGNWFLKKPEVIYKLHIEFLKDFFLLHHNIVNKLFNNATDENKIDRRFQHPYWDQQTYFYLIKETYLAINRYTRVFIDQIEGVDDKTLVQFKIYVKNILDTFSPSNFLPTNPELIAATINSSGENLLKGFDHFLRDLVKNMGHFNISMTDFDAFKVGHNLAITPGKVIYQNDLVQLIQYLPTTKKVYEKPILFIPPWINKYYLLDITPEKSLVKWLVDQGFTVFMISWISPGLELAHKKFEDYMLEGPVQCMEQVLAITNAPSLHLVGYCLGGTLLGCTLAYMQHSHDNRVASGSYFTTMLDFSNPGELEIFIDEQQINALEKIMNEKGYLDGRLLDMAFNSLKPNDLIWPHFINNYLLGEEPRPSELHYWNADSVHLIANTYKYYLRNMYLYNLLCKPGGIILNNVPIDLKKITTSVCFISTEKDHITPWKATYLGTQLHSGLVTFVLTDFGHIRGIINPPRENNKCGYRVNNNMVEDPDEWLRNSVRHENSWWPFWKQWLLQHGEKRVLAREIKKSGANIIEDAPGSYVLKQI